MRRSMPGWRCCCARRSRRAISTPGRRRRIPGWRIFALGKHGGRELNYSSDIDIVAFFDREAGVLAEPDEATKTFLSAGAEKARE